MAVVQKQSVRNPAGVQPTMNAASAGGDQIQAPGSDLLVLVRNASGVSVTATFVTPGNLSTGQAFPDTPLVVPAGQDRIIFIGAEYLDSNGQVSITWSATASVTFAAMSVA